MHSSIDFTELVPMKIRIALEGQEKDITKIDITKIDIDRFSEVRIQIEVDGDKGRTIIRLDDYIDPNDNEIAFQNRYRHIVGVTKSAANFAHDIYPGTNQKSKKIRTLLMVIAAVHDLGYSRKINKRKWHPIDGYYELKEKGFPKEVFLPVLFHSFADNHSRYMPENTMAGIKNFYTKLSSYIEFNELKEVQDLNTNKVNYLKEKLNSYEPMELNIKKLIKFITYWDLTTFSDGRPVDILERINDVLHRYPPDDTANGWVNTYLQKEDKLWIKTVNEINEFHSLAKAIIH